MTDTKYNITLFEVCETLGRSRKSLSRYIRKGLLHPQEIKSKRGALEYRFSQEDIEAFKQKESLMRQDKADSETGHKEKTDTPLTDKNKEKVLDKGQNSETGHLDSETGHSETHIYSREAEKGENVLTKPLDSETGHPKETGQAGTEKIIKLLEDTTGILKQQLTKKDEQIGKLNHTIGELVERNRETNILLKGLQERVFMLEQPKEKPVKQEKTGESRKPKGFFNQFFN